MSMDGLSSDLEIEFKRQFLPNGKGGRNTTSIYEYLRNPGGEETLGEAVADVLLGWEDEQEPRDVVVGLLSQFARSAKVWLTHRDPALREERAYFDEIDSIERKHKPDAWMRGFLWGDHLAQRARLITRPTATRNLAVGSSVYKRVAEDTGSSGATQRKKQRRTEQATDNDTTLSANASNEERVSSSTSGYIGTTTESAEIAQAQASADENSREATDIQDFGHSDKVMGLKVGSKRESEAKGQPHREVEGEAAAEERAPTVLEGQSTRSTAASMEQNRLNGWYSEGAEWKEHWMRQRREEVREESVREVCRGPSVCPSRTSAMNMLASVTFASMTSRFMAGKPEINAGDGEPTVECCEYCQSDLQRGLQAYTALLKTVAERHQTG